MTRELLRVWRLSVPVLGLLAAAHCCIADTVTVASANPYASFTGGNGPLTLVTSCTPGFSGCALQFTYDFGATCYSPQANPKNWPNGTLISYNTGASEGECDVSLGADHHDRLPGNVRGRVGPDSFRDAQL